MNIDELNKFEENLRWRDTDGFLIWNSVMEEEKYRRKFFGKIFENSNLVIEFEIQIWKLKKKMKYDTENP